MVDLFNAIDASPLPALTGLVNNAGIIGFDMPQTLETATTEAFEGDDGDEFTGTVDVLPRGGKADGAWIRGSKSLVGQRLPRPTTALLDVQRRVEFDAARSHRAARGEGHTDQHGKSPGVTETDMVSICVEINQCVGCIRHDSARTRRKILISTHRYQSSRTARSA